MITSGLQADGRPVPLRLTRRGRVVLVTFFIIVASLVGALLATASRASQPTPAPVFVPVSRSTVIGPAGDVPWQIVSTLSGVPPMVKRGAPDALRRPADAPGNR